jgi:hypothetical protein
MSAEIIPFEFEGREVRTVTIDGEPWFVAADLCTILGYKNSRKAIADHVDSEDKGVTKRDTVGGSQSHTIVNESGLYTLILRSTLPQAKRFKHWVTSEVLPTIRKTGQFQFDVPFLMPTCKPWTKTFPDDFNSHVFRLKGLVPAEHPRWMGHIHNDLVYSRVAENVYEALRLLNPRLPGKTYRGKKHHQFIATGSPEKHFIDFIGQCRGMMAAFETWDPFHAAWDQLHPVVRQLPRNLGITFADGQLTLFNLRDFASLPPAKIK